MALSISIGRPTPLRDCFRPDAVLAVSRPPVRPNPFDLLIAHMKSPNDASYDQSVSGVHNRLFFRVFQIGNTLERQATKEIGMTSVQWSVLGALSRPKVITGMPFSDLAEYLGVSRQNLDGVLKRLERDKHVLRIADTVDRRAKLVILTQSGRSFWDSMQPKIYEFYRQALEEFRFDDKIAFVHYLNRLNEGMKKVDLAPSREKAGKPQQEMTP